LAANEPGRRQRGEVVALRYITTDARIEICWPCRVVEDSGELLALFIAAGTPYKAGPKRTARAKRSGPRLGVPPNELVWRNDTLRLMVPGERHSVLLFWSDDNAPRRLLKYFINLEEPFRRTQVGFDTQDHTLDVELTPDLAWRWRDEAELENHVTEGFYSAELAAAARAEGRRVIDAILAHEHVCTRWTDWQADAAWQLPGFVGGWDTAPRTLWDQGAWAYPDAASTNADVRPGRDRGR
jgi:predicted RNA-binding protein associated with RNAse of E/G family